MAIGKTEQKTNAQKIDKIKCVYIAKYNLNELGKNLFGFFNKQCSSNKIFLYISKEDFEKQYKKDNLFNNYDELTYAYKLVNCDFSTSELKEIGNIDIYFSDNLTTDTDKIKKYEEIKVKDYDKFYSEINANDDDKYLALSIATFQVYLVNHCASIDGTINWLYKRIESVFNNGNLIEKFFKSGRANYRYCQRNLWHIVKSMFNDKLAFPTTELPFDNKNKQCFIQYIRCHWNPNLQNVTVNNTKKIPATLKVTSDGFEVDQNIDIDELTGKLFLQDDNYSNEYHLIEKKVQSGSSKVWFLTNDQLEKVYYEKSKSDIDSDGDKVTDNVLYLIRSGMLDQFVESLDDYELNAASLKKIKLVGGVLDPISSANGEKHKYLIFGLPRIETEDNLKANAIKLKKTVGKVSCVKNLGVLNLSNLTPGLYELSANGYMPVKFEVKDATCNIDKSIRDKCGWYLNTKFEINDFSNNDFKINLCGLNIQ